MENNNAFNVWKRYQTKNLENQIQDATFRRGSITPEHNELLMKKTGERLTEWFDEVKKAHPDMTQGKLADLLCVTQPHLCNVMKGKRPLTSDNAIMISMYTDSGRDTLTNGVVRVRPQWLLCLDDFKFESDILENAFDSSSNMDKIIREYLSRDYYEIKQIVVNEAEGIGTPVKNPDGTDNIYFEISRNGQFVRRLSLDEYFQTRKELFNFIAFTLNKWL